MSSFLTGTKTLKSYHVQFFGIDEDRAWVSLSRMIPFESKEKLIEKLDHLRSKASKTERKLYDQPPANLAPWKLAVTEAEEAFPLDRQERRSNYTFVYSDKPQPRKPSHPRPPRHRPPKRKLEDVEEEEEEEELSVPKKRVRRYSLDIPNPTHVQFLVFSSKKRDGFRKKHPSFTEAKVTELLKQEWDKLTSDEKAKFIPMGSGVEDVGLGKRFSGTVYSEYFKLLKFTQPLLFSM